MYSIIEIPLMCLHIIVLALVGVALNVWWIIKDLKEELRYKEKDILNYRRGVVNGYRVLGLKYEFDEEDWPELSISPDCKKDITHNR